MGDVGTMQDQLKRHARETHGNEPHEYRNSQLMPTDEFMGIVQKHTTWKGATQSIALDEIAHHFSVPVSWVEDRGRWLGLWL